MPRNIGLLLAIVADLVTLQGCWGYSLHPLYDDKHLTYDLVLEGRWQCQPGQCVAVITREESTLKFSAQETDWLLKLTEGSK